MSKRMSIRASFTSANGMGEALTSIRNNPNNRILPEIFKHRLLNSAEETVSKLQSIWKEAGYEDSECHRLLGEILEKVNNIFASELSTEQQIIEHARVEVDTKIKLFVQFSRQLGRDSESCVSNLASMNLTDKLSELESLIHKISAEVEQRQTLMDIELAAINKLADQLDEPCPSCDSEIFSGPEGTPELSDLRLQLMKQCREDLEHVRHDRMNKMIKILQDSMRNVKDMMLDEEGFHTLDIDKKYSSEYEEKFDQQLSHYYKTDEFVFQVRKSDMNHLQTRMSRVGQEKELRRAQLAATGSEIARLWTLLRIPSTERDAFQKSFKMNLSMATLSAGFDELAGLKQIRKTSLDKVVGSIRNDILALWEEAGIEDDIDRKREFSLFYSKVEDLDESAVDSHEAYFCSLRDRVELLKPILQKIARREGIVQERVELEHIQLNPERLTARGPNAREERKREETMTNRVRNLDKITKELMTQIQAWEEENGPFVFMGERYADRVLQQEEAYAEIRESLRNARKKKNGKIEPAVLQPKTPGTSKKNGSMLASSSLSSMSKDKDLSQVGALGSFSSSTCWQSASFDNNNSNSVLKTPSIKVFNPLNNENISPQLN